MFMQHLNFIIYFLLLIYFILEQIFSPPLDHIFIFFSRFFSYIDYPRILGRVSHAIQQVPTGQSFHIAQHAYAHPKPSGHPSCLSCTLW